MVMFSIFFTFLMYSVLLTPWKYKWLISVVYSCTTLHKTNLENIHKPKGINCDFWKSRGQSLSLLRVKSILSIPTPLCQRVCLETSQCHGSNTFSFMPYFSQSSFIINKGTMIFRCLIARKSDQEIFSRNWAAIKESNFVWKFSIKFCFFLFFYFVVFF